MVRYFYSDELAAIVDILPNDEEPMNIDEQWTDKGRMLRFVLWYAREKREGPGTSQLGGEDKEKGRRMMSVCHMSRPAGVPWHAVVPKRVKIDLEDACFVC